MNIQEYLKEHTLLFDGAMGSYFATIHDDPHYPCEYANITSPKTIGEIHKRYLMAGAKAIKTNTFSLPVEETSPYTIEEIIQSAYQIAKEQAAPFEAYVFADICTYQIIDDQDALSQYKHIVDLFLTQGASHFLFETCSSALYLDDLAKHIKEKNPTAFVMASFAVSADGFSKEGESIESLFQGLSDDIDALGLNCICGPNHMMQLLKTIQTKKYLSAMPNASYPTVAGNRVAYSQNPSYYGEALRDMASMGCQIIGGCCGTTPEFISQINKQLNQVQREEKPVPTPVVLSEQPVIKSDFYEKLKSGKKPIAVEWDSPVVPEITEYMANAEKLKLAGVDMITIADCPVARPRMDSSLVACKLKRELNIHAMPHMTCRDRNINAAKALLLGLSVEEVNNVLIITGDPIPQEQKKEIKTVYEFNSRKLIGHINQLNQSLFHSPFYLYGALNVNALNFKVQLQMAQDKVEKGCVAFFTQPVMSERGLENLKIAKEALSVPLVGGIYPATSYRNIWFLTNEISGFHVAPEIVALYQDKTPEECSELAVKISSRIAQEISPYIDGYYLITPFKRVELILDIMKQLPSDNG